MIDVLRRALALEQEQERQHQHQHHQHQQQQPQKSPTGSAPAGYRNRVANNADMARICSLSDVSKMAHLQGAAHAPTSDANAADSSGSDWTVGDAGAGVPDGGESLLGRMKPLAPESLARICSASDLLALPQPRSRQHNISKGAKRGR